MPEPIGVHPKSQIEKRIDDLETRCNGGGGGVGEYLDDGHTCERFNDYRAHTFNETTQKWTGGNWSDKIYDHIEGFGNKVIDTRGRVHSTSYPGYNHVEGYENYVETTDGYGPYCHVEGYRNKLKNGFAMHVGGMNNTVEGGNSGLVHGRNNTVKGLFCGIVSGEYNTVGTAENSSISHVGVFGNNCVIKRDYCIAIGSGLDIGQYESYYLVVGDHARNGDHPPFAVDGNGNIYGRTLHLTDYAYAAGFTSRGADYAEYFEWLDGNPDNEDRCGMLVSLNGDKIELAHGDEIFGIISAAPSVVGNAFENEWHGKYARDIYGRIITTPGGEPLISPDFDPGREYIPRSKRPEWAAVGMTGRLVINDDGSCKVGGFVSARRGVGTSCFKNTGIRVLRRINERHVEVIIR